MTRTARRRVLADLEAEAAITFDAALAEGIAELTGCACVLMDYDDAGRAVRRWFALMDEDGARH